MPDFIGLESVFAIHYEQIEGFGGSHGLRDQALLESALGAARQTHGYTDGLLEAAAQYLISIARNHPFVDGNKRTGTACMLVFLDLNGHELAMPPAHLFELVLNAATGNCDRAAIVRELSPYVRSGSEGQEGDAASILQRRSGQK